jgi:hypothetical protein
MKPGNDLGRCRAFDFLSLVCTREGRGELAPLAQDHAECLLAARCREVFRVDLHVPTIQRELAVARMQGASDQAAGPPQPAREIGRVVPALSEVSDIDDYRHADVVKVALRDPPADDGEVALKHEAVRGCGSCLPAEGCPRVGASRIGTGR